MVRNKIILVLCLFQIILIINFTFAQSYNLSEDKIGTNLKINLFEKLAKNGLKFMIGFFSIKQIGFVSAESCCEKTLEGALCQEVESADECNPSFDNVPTKCIFSTFCKQGWCIDKKGLCSQSSQSKCEGGSWSTNKPDDCNSGCCELGTNTQYIEKSWCEKNNGIFDATKPRTSCKYLSSDEKGACVYETTDGKTCELNTQIECSRISGSRFNNGILCSNPTLETDCEKQQSINCEDGKIYWFDSCGNRENIYSGNDENSKELNWNSGFVDKFGKCTSGSECGNCDLANSICKKVSSSETHVAEDNFVCADLGCIDETDGNKYRKNGESWCIYEGQVGEYSDGDVEISADIPGSSHYKKSCSQGEISTINCGEYRTQICAENVTQIKGEDFSIAECRPNLGRKCFSIETKAECETEPDCRMQTVDVVKDSDVDFFHFEACVPKYPMGFNLHSSINWNNGNSVCGIASINCPIVEQYKFEDECLVRDPIWNTCTTWFLQKVSLGYIVDEECAENAERYYSQMNDLCISLGDCAGYLNTEGVYTGRSSLSNRYNEIIENENTDNVPRFLGMNVGASTSSIALNLINSRLGEISCADTSEGEICEETLSNDERDLNKWRTLNMGIGAAVSWIPYWGHIVAAIAVVIEVVLFQWTDAGKVGEIERSEKTFTCAPWEPPIKSDDCGICNDGNLPCTEYKCWSLGKNCEVLKNVYGTEEPICIEKYEDITEPIIEFKNVKNFVSTITTNGVSITNNSDDKKCLNGNDFLSFNLTTDKDEENKFSKCVWGEEHSNLNEYKSIWTGTTTSGNYLAKEHEFNLRVPYYENKYVDESGNYKMYIRCENNNGVANVAEYVVDMCINPTLDLRPPVIERFEPANNGYLKYGGDVLENLKVYTNKPVVSCKYSFDEETSYDSMISSLVCDSDGKRQIEYACNFGKIEGLNEQNNEIYFKCNDTHGNVMREYQKYEISQSVSELKISSTLPSGYNQVNSKDNFYPMTLKITTSGGADGTTGASKCYWNYSWINIDSSADKREHLFFSTDSTIHTQELNLYKGIYEIPIRCKDSVGNEAKSYVNFNLDIDNKAPEIATIYNSGSLLGITTHENSRCYYNTENINCDVPVKDSTTLMQPGIEVSKLHYIDWDSEKIYHIQCVDNLGNVGSCVSISPSLF